MKTEPTIADFEAAREHCKETLKSLRIADLANPSVRYKNHIRLEEINQRAIDLAICALDMVPALWPFARFYKDERHDLSPANPGMIVGTFMDQETKEPLVEILVSDFRRAYEAHNAAVCHLEGKP